MATYSKERTSKGIAYRYSFDDLNAGTIKVNLLMHLVNQATELGYLSKISADINPDLNGTSYVAVRLEDKSKLEIKVSTSVPRLQNTSFNLEIEVSLKEVGLKVPAEITDPFFLATIRYLDNLPQELGHQE